MTNIVYYVIIYTPKVEKEVFLMKKTTQPKPTKADNAKAKERFVASGLGLKVVPPKKAKTTEK